MHGFMYFYFVVGLPWLLLSLFLISKFIMVLDIASVILEF